MTVINEYDKPASEVKPGNYVFGVKVLKAEPKRVNTTLTLEKPVAGHDTYPFKLMDMLTVGVEEKTDEEKAELDLKIEREMQDFFAKRVREFVTQSKLELESVANERAERAKAGWCQLDYSSVQKELKAYARFDMGQLIADTMEQHTENGASEFDAASAAIDMIVKQITKAAMQFSASSRSTNQISNFCEDFKLETAAQFIESLPASVNLLNRF